MFSVACCLLLFFHQALSVATDGYVSTEFYTGTSCDGSLILSQAVAINACISVNGTAWTSTTNVAGN
jgi:hypothetical protein